MSISTDPDWRGLKSRSRLSVSTAKAALEAVFPWRLAQEGRQADGSGSGRPGRRVHDRNARCCGRRRFLRRARSSRSAYIPDEPDVGRDHLLVTRDRTAQMPARQFLGVYRRAPGHAGQAGPLGWTLPAALGGRAADPDREIVALSGGLRFSIPDRGARRRPAIQDALYPCRREQFLSRMIRQRSAASRGLSGETSFENIQCAGAWAAYGVDHVAVAEGLGARRFRVTDSSQARADFYDQRRNGWRLQQCRRGTSSSSKRSQT